MRTKTYKKITFLFFFSLLCLLSWSPFWQISQIPQVNAASTTFTSSSTWVVPTGVSSVIIEAWGGAGAGGGGGNVNNNSGGGGAGGQYAKKTISVSAGTTYAVTVGSGGTSPSNTSTGGSGGYSSFAVIGAGTTYVVAKGGVGGNAGAGGGGTGGVGTTASGVGDTTYKGGNGGDGSQSSYASGGGGGGAGSIGTGGNASGTTAGVGTSAYGGNGGIGVATPNTVGNPGSQYGGAGSGGTRNGLGGAGAQGFIRLTYNTPPSFTVNTTDVPDPVNLGNSVTFAATATDSDSNNWYLAVCKTNSVTSGTPPTCATDQTYCVSSSSVSSASENSCSWTSTGSGNQDWYSFACDNSSVSPACSSANTVNSPITVNETAFYSVSVTPDGVISFGIIVAGQSQNTVQLTETRTATNDGNVPAKFNIKSSNATNGTSWTLGSSAGENIFVHEFSTTGGEPWTKFTDPDTYETLISSIGVTDTVDFDLKITTPTNSDAIQKTITIIVQASAL